MDLIKAFSEMHMLCKNNMAINNISTLDIFLQGHGIGKQYVSYDGGGSVTKLLHAINETQLETDRAELCDNLFSTAVDENTTRSKCASTIMIRCCFFLTF